MFFNNLCCFFQTPVLHILLSLSRIYSTETMGGEKRREHLQTNVPLDVASSNASSSDMRVFPATSSITAAVHRELYWDIKAHGTIEGDTWRKDLLRMTGVMTGVPQGFHRGSTGLAIRPTSYYISVISTYTNFSWAQNTWTSEELLNQLLYLKQILVDFKTFEHTWDKRTKVHRNICSRMKWRILHVESGFIQQAIPSQRTCKQTSSQFWFRNQWKMNSQILEAVMFQWWRSTDTVLLNIKAIRPSAGTCGLIELNNCEQWKTKTRTWSRRQTSQSRPHWLIDRWSMETPQRSISSQHQHFNQHTDGLLTSLTFW